MWFREVVWPSKSRCRILATWRLTLAGTRVSSLKTSQFHQHQDTSIPTLTWISKWHSTHATSTTIRTKLAKPRSPARLKVVRPCPWSSWVNQSLKMALSHKSSTLTQLFARPPLRTSPSRTLRIKSGPSTPLSAQRKPTTSQERRPSSCPPSPLETTKLSTCLS